MFLDQQSTQQFDYMSLAYGFEGIQRDPNAENPGEKLIKTKETVMMNLMILDENSSHLLRSNFIYFFQN